MSHEGMQPRWKRVGPWLGLGVAYVMVPSLLYLTYWWQNGKDHVERGTFGDMFGGTNALFSGLAFATLIVTAWMQRQELELQRRELTETREVMKEQASTFKQQRLESTFFEMLRAHEELVGRMHYGNGYRGRDYFQELIRQWFNNCDAKLPIGLMAKHEPRSADGVLACYEETRRNHDDLLSAYFRSVYHLLKLVDTATVENASWYTGLVRASMTQNELLWLAMNGLSSQGVERFKPLAEKYQLFKHLAVDRLPSGGALAERYEPRAFGVVGFHP